MNLDDIDLEAMLKHVEFNDYPIVGEKLIQLVKLANAMNLLILERVDISVFDRYDGGIKQLHLIISGQRDTRMLLDALAKITWAQMLDIKIELKCLGLIGVPFDGALDCYKAQKMMTLGESDESSG